MPRVIVACVAGGIVGLRKVKFWQNKVLAAKRAAKPREKCPLHILLTPSLLLAAPPPKLYFGCTYTIPPTMQASFIENK